MSGLHSPAPDFSSTHCAARCTSSATLPTLSFFIDVQAIRLDGLGTDVHPGSDLLGGEPLTTRQVGPTRFQVHPDARAALLRYAWPGNVRELANVRERAQILAEGSVITLDDLPDNVIIEPLAGGDETEGESQKLQQMQRRHVLAVLHKAKGNKVHAARELGISHRALYRLLEKYQIKPQEESAADV